MGEINGSRYPERLNAGGAVDIADKAVNEFDAAPPGHEAFAEALGHATANSGAYITKVADARNYGLLPKQGLDPTSLAHRVANPKDERELTEGLFEMYQNVSPLRDLYEHLGGREPPEQLWSVLVEVTGASRKAAKEAEDDLKALYEDMLRVDAKRHDRARPSSGVRRRGSSELVATPGADGDIYLKVGDDVHSFEELTPVNVELAQRILESKKPDGSETGPVKER